MKKILVGLFLLAFAGSAFAQTSPALTYRTPTSITTGGTFQAILAAGTKRSLTIQNNNTTTDNCWLDFGSGVTASNASAANGILLTPGQAYTRYYPYVPNNEIEATCTTTGNTLRVDVQ